MELDVLKKTVLFVVLEIVVFVFMPLSVQAGSFCGIDQGYSAVVNEQGKICQRTWDGIYFQCVNSGMWDCAGTFDCKRYTVITRDGTTCQIVPLSNCNLGVYAYNATNGTSCDLSSYNTVCTLNSSSTTGCWVYCDENSWSACSVACGGGTQTNACGTTRECNTQPCCTPTNPDAPVLSSPANVVQVRVNQAVTLGWGAISNWGTGCPTNNNRYEVCVMSGSTCDLVNYVSAGTNTTYSWTPSTADNVVTWKVRSNNGSNTNESGTRTVCVEGGATYGTWSACNVSTHKRTRTCTETCGTDDCTAAGAVGGVITEDCVGTIQGALFDASDYSSCPADLITNPGNYSDVLIANRSFNMTSPFGSPSWPGVSAATRTLTTNTNGFYTLNAYAPGTYTYDFSALGGDYTGVDDPKLKCTSAAAGLPGCNTADMTQPCTTATLPNMSFGFWRVYGGWWQATGGNVYANNGLGSAIPASIPAANQRLILSDSFGRSGILSHGFAWAGTELGTNSNATVSTPLWRIQSTYGGLRYDFDYYQTRMDMFVSSTWEGTLSYSDDDRARGYKLYKIVSGGLDLTGLSLTDENIIFLVDGNVNVTGDLITPSGAFLGIIASGNITFNPNVTTAQGWFVAETINIPCSDDNVDPVGTCDKDDVQFAGEGSFVGWTTVNLGRDMGVGNNSAPSEKFVYRPDLYLNAPDPVKVYTKKFTPFIP